MDLLWEKSRDVGRLVSQSEEYRAFQRANERLSDDRETLAQLHRLRELEEGFTRAIEQGQEPPREEQEEYQRIAEGVQVSPAYQAFEAARSNFDRLMYRVQEEIAKGIESGEKSRIILA